MDVSDELIHENEEFKEILEMYKTPDEKGLSIRAYSDGYEENLRYLQMHIITI